MAVNRGLNISDQININTWTNALINRIAGTMRDVEATLRYRHSVALTWELADDRAVILDAAGSTLTTLSPVGTADLAAARRAARHRRADRPPRRLLPRRRSGSSSRRRHRVHGRAGTRRPRRARVRRLTDVLRVEGVRRSYRPASGLVRLLTRTATDTHRRRPRRRRPPRASPAASSAWSAPTAPARPR